MNAFRTSIADTTGQDRVITTRPRGAMKKWLIPSLTLGSLIVAGLLFGDDLQNLWQADRSISAERLRTAVVDRGDLVRDLVVEGQTLATSYPTLYAPAKGIVLATVRPGQRVTRGQVLATISSPELRSLQDQEAFSLAAAEADLERQKLAEREMRLDLERENQLRKLRYEAAKRALERTSRTHALGLVNQIDLEIAKDDVAITQLEYEGGLAGATLTLEKAGFEIRTLDARVRRQRLALEELQRQVTGLDIRAPVDGIVGNVQVSPSEHVALNQPLLTVIDLSAFEVQVTIPEAYVDNIAPGLEVLITLEGNTYRGSLDHISPEVESGTVVGTVNFADAEPAGLKQNQRVSARLLLESRDNVLKVRRGPFIENFGGRSVYVLEGDLAHLREIRVGALSLTEAEILSGLSEGDTIILTDMTQFENAPTILVRQNH